VDLPPGRVRAWRKTLDVLLTAQSYEEAREAADAAVGSWLAPPGGVVSYEEFYGLEREGAPVEGVDPDLGFLNYRGRVTMVAPARSVDHAAEAFGSLLGSVATEAFVEIFFEATDDSPPEEGTMSDSWGGGVPS
jgi:hypothetical protein